MLQVMKAGKEGALVDLPCELRAHVDSCRYCSATLPEWIAGCAGMKRRTEETELMMRGAAGDPSVLRRAVNEGTALFQPAKTEDAPGLMVIVRDQSVFHILRSVRLTRAEFDHWQ